LLLAGRFSLLPLVFRVLIAVQQIPVRSGAGICIVYFTFCFKCFQMLTKFSPEDSKTEGNCSRPDFVSGKSRGSDADICSAGKTYGKMPLTGNQHGRNVAIPRDRSHPRNRDPDDGDLPFPL
jgi:hypothetical protein